MPETVPFAIAIPTFRRPERLATLLADLERNVVVPDGFTLRAVMVVDNDAQPSSRHVVDPTASSLPLRYVHEPKPGISAARNRAMAELSDVAYVAMIDDDELLVADWPAGLLRTALVHDAQLVGGPVDPRPQGPAPEWMLRPHMLGRAEHADGAAPAKVPSTNLLVDRRLVGRIDPLFDPAFGLSGGSDTLLCHRVRALGGEIRWSATARTAELYPPERLTMAWLRRRWRRNGANMVAIDLALAPSPADRWRLRLRRTAEGAARMAGAPVLYLRALTAQHDRPYRRATAQRQLFQGWGLLLGVAGRRPRSYGSGGVETSA